MTLSERATKREADLRRFMSTRRGFLAALASVAAGARALLAGDTRTPALPIPCDHDGMRIPLEPGDSIVLLRYTDGAWHYVP